MNKLLTTITLLCFSVAANAQTTHVSCAGILNIQEGYDQDLKEFVKKGIIDFKNGYLFALMQNVQPLPVSQRLYEMDNEAFYRFFLNKCNENPDKNSLTVMQELVDEIT